MEENGSVVMGVPSSGLDDMDWAEGRRGGDGIRPLCTLSWLCVHCVAPKRLGIARCSKE